jgi:hypothetical protein
MNATLPSKTAGGMRNYPLNLLPNRHIHIVFVSLSPFEPRVKNAMNSNLIAAIQPSSARAVPRLNATGLPATLKTPRFPCTEWLSPPDTLKDTGANDQLERDRFDASMRALNYRPRRDNSMPALKLVEFSVTLPDAKMVQLAADFTDWDEAPLDMIRFDGGIWSTTVPLPAGIYAYRFLADGEWYDDPRAAQRDPHSPGAAKAFVQIK